MNLDRICALCAAEGSNLSKLERAKQFDVLPDDKKQLVKVYMSVVSAQ